MLTKGHDRIIATFSNAVENVTDSEQVDEIIFNYDCRYLSLWEAARRIFSFDISVQKPAVERLSLHLPDHQYLLYDENQDLEQVCNKEASTFIC